MSGAWNAMLLDEEATAVVAEALAAGSGEPRPGRFERTMAQVAVTALREAGMLSPTEQR